MQPIVGLCIYSHFTNVFNLHAQNHQLFSNNELRTNVSLMFSCDYSYL